MTHRQIEVGTKLFPAALYILEHNFKQFKMSISRGLSHFILEKSTKCNTIQLSNKRIRMWEGRRRRQKGRKKERGKDQERS